MNKFVNNVSAWWKSWIRRDGESPGQSVPSESTTAPASQPGKARAVGIDLGTTFSAAAYLTDMGQTAMIRNVDGKFLTPSVVWFERDEIVVGSAARRMAVIENEHVAEWVKRDMGSKAYSRSIHGQHLPPEIIQAYILKQLKKDITAVLGSNFKAVITVPAYFDGPRRQATMDAGRMAGLDVLDIINEPKAAALAFAEHLGYLSPTESPQENMNILVYDLGGGTFDVTIMQLIPGDFRDLAIDGDVRLGGHDWDERLVNYFSEVFLKQHGVDPRHDRSMYAELIYKAEETKHSLSQRSNTSVQLDYAGHSCLISITRDQFEEMTEDLLQRTTHTTRHVITAAKLQWKNINCVLLVGGSTRMPMVSRMLEILTGITPDRSVNPDEAVARGAALYAGNLLNNDGSTGYGKRFHVVNVNAHSLGIEGTNIKTGKKENAILIQRNTQLPAEKPRIFFTKTNGQTSVLITVLEGESSNPDNCIIVGRALLRELPPDLPKGHPIKVKYRYETNGILQVRAKVPGTGHALDVEFHRPQALSSQRILQLENVVRSEKGIDAIEKILDEVLFDKTDLQ